MYLFSLCMHHIDTKRRFHFNADDVKYDFFSNLTTSERFCAANVFFILICDVDFELSVSTQYSSLAPFQNNHIIHRYSAERKVEFEFI